MRVRRERQLSVFVDARDCATPCGDRAAMPVRHHICSVRGRDGANGRLHLAGARPVEDHAVSANETLDLDAVEREIAMLLDGPHVYSRVVPEMLAGHARTLIAAVRDRDAEI